MKFEKRGQRLFVRENDETIASISYKEADKEAIIVTSTVVAPELRGQGIAERLVDKLVQEIEKQDKKIVSDKGCSYVVDLFKRKPEKYANIIAKS